MLGAYSTFAAVCIYGLPYPIAIVASLLSMAILGVLFHYAIIPWTMPHGFFHMMLATIAFRTIISKARY